MASLFIPNPMKGQEATQRAAGLQRTVTIMVAAIVVGAFVMAALVYFVADLPVVALIVLVAELGAMIVLLRALPKSMSQQQSEFVVARSYLAGIEISQFVQPQQLWDAAVAVRDNGDKARARMILGS